MHSKLRTALTNKFILDQESNEDSGIWDMYFELVKKSLFRKLNDSEKEKLKEELKVGDIDSFVSLCESKLEKKDYDIINNYIHLKISKLF